ncbi:hypothetical protein HZY83_05650 [Gemella sp. GH3]|uniref:hypothetical protein n=1 Tax=unclassified Gemella TaxID=2624949 RepID=UPI0015D04301|nr:MULTISPECIES: hypothetical protein [unclassified Gemella]MBF0714154.1 hypothetical protein [Gemella sp. GH3.1]NYS51106.1 hypothetical protein [Gemella sp. GH3]
MNNKIKKIIIISLVLTPMFIINNYVDEFVNDSIIYKIMYNIYKFIFVVTFVTIIVYIVKNFNNIEILKNTINSNLV